MIRHWLMTLMLFSSILLTHANGIHQPRITVGIGLTCHYPPKHLNQALQEHNTLYLTTETVFPPIIINNPQAHIIGGLSDCDNLTQQRNNSQKSIISGFNRHRPITIKPGQLKHATNTSIQLKKLRLIDGHADAGGGLDITGPAKIRLEDIVIENNTATSHGGGIALKGPTIELHVINSMIQFNQAQRRGGGISCQGNHHIKFEGEQPLNFNQAPLAENYLLDQACFIKINQSD